MDSIFAPGIDGTYQELFGRTVAGLFCQRLEKDRFLFRHEASGLSLFYFIGSEKQAGSVQTELAGNYDFHRDSTWVLKGQSEIHSLLRAMGLKRRWLFRAWHYEFPRATRPRLDLTPSRRNRRNLVSEQRLPSHNFEAARPDKTPPGNTTDYT